MIPIGWDDGFSTVIAGVITVRPMLQDRRAQYKQYLEYKVGDAKTDVSRTLFRTPNYFGPKYESLSADIKEQCVKAIFGYDVKEERRHIQEIVDGVTLLVKHPGFARLPCDICRQYAVTEDGEVVVNPANGKPIPRPPIGVQCERGKYCPKGHWKNPREVTPFARMVWSHYWQWPGNHQNCPIMARNAALIRWIINGKPAGLNPFDSGTSFLRASRGIVGFPLPGGGVPVPQSGAAETSISSCSGDHGADTQVGGTEDTGSVPAEGDDSR